MNSWRSTAFMVLLLYTAATARAENWSRFRGPNGSGVSAERVPVRWTAQDYAWRIELPGVGHSSPVLWGEHVFVTAADEDAGRRTLLCVNAIDGTVRWTHDFEFKPFRKHGENSFASSTPAVDDKHVYTSWIAPEQYTVLAVRHDGTEAWRADLGPYKAEHGGGASPIVHGGLVIISLDQNRSGSFVAALDRDTGKVRWRTPRNSTKFSASTPCVLTPKVGPEQLVFTTHANGFTALDPASGKVLWELPGTFQNRVVSSPVAAGDLVLGTAGEGSRGEAVVAVRPPIDDGAKPEIAYKLSEEMPYVPTPLVHDGRLFTWSDSGTVTCHDAATGEKRWAGKVRGGFFASPICAGGKLYCVSKRGEVVVVNASADKFGLLARNDLAEASDATPAVADGRLYLRTLSHLICVGGPAAKTAAAAAAARPLSR